MFDADDIKCAAVVCVLLCSDESAILWRSVGGRLFRLSFATLLTLSAEHHWHCQWCYWLTIRYVYCDIADTLLTV